MKNNEILNEANEALQRTLLMMNYDMKKTLTENVDVINEQNVNCGSNPISEDELESIVDNLWDTLQNMQELFVRSFSSTGSQGLDNAKEIFNSINNASKRTVKDDLTGKCVPGIVGLKEAYAERAKKGGLLFSTTGDLVDEIKNAANDSVFKSEQGKKGQKYMNAAIQVLTTGKPFGGGDSGTAAASAAGTSSITSTSLEDLKKIQQGENSNVNNVPAWKVKYPNSIIYFANNGRFFQYTADGKSLTQKGNWKIENGKIIKTYDGSNKKEVVGNQNKKSVPAVTDKNLLSTLNFEYKFPGDNTYVYDFVPNTTVTEQTNNGGTWYAKNLKTGKVFNISQNFPQTEKKLNTEFPSAANPVDKSPKDTNTTSEKTTTDDVSQIKGKGLESKPVSPDLSQPKNITLPQKTNTATTKTTSTPEKQDMSNLDVFGPATESLKKSLKKNLMEVKENKENLMVETNIVEKRFNFIVEGKSFETEDEQDYLVESVISEIGYLKTQGYTPKAINEGLFSMLGSLLGGAATSAPAVFGEYIASWLTKQLGIPQNSYMNGVIVSLVGNLNIADYDRFFSDCRFASNKIADSLIEGYLLQLQNEKNANSGASGFIVSALRNSVVDYFAEDKNSLIQILEDKIGEFVCPKLSKLSGVISDKADDIKAKAVA
jgi:hypothetical protein